MLNKLAIHFLLLSAAFAQNAERIQGTVEDQTGARIAGARISLHTQSSNYVMRTTSTSEGLFVFQRPSSGLASIRVELEGFQPFTRSLTLENGTAAEVHLTLSASTVIESVDVIASADLLQSNSSTQTTSLTTRQIQSLPTASRNYTHLIVGEAGVAAPLPDRTGRGMNLATSPGSQADDGTQSLNPSVNGARPTNNSLMINGVDATNMMNGGGSLGNNIAVPLDALEAVEMQTALYSAATGRNGGANIQMITRTGTNAFHGSASHFFQNEILNANEFFLNRSGGSRPKFRRNESYAGLGGPIVKNKTFFHAAVQRTGFLSGYASRAIVTTASPDGLSDMRTPATIAQVANQWLQTGAQDNPQFAANFLSAIRRFPAEQIPGLERQFFVNTSDPASPVFRELTAADIHPVAINILNAKREGKLLLPSVTSQNRLLPGNASYGREREQVNAFPTFFNSWSGSLSLEHNFSGNDRLRLNYVKSQQFVEEAFPWANSSASPTQGLTPGYVASLSHLHTFGPYWVNELRGGFFELYNTRISKFRDIFNSTLGIYNPLEHSLGGLASLMPTVDIVTQRSGAGIGNAWDFYDRQRNAYASDSLTRILGAHTLQFGGEARRTNLKGEYMARTNGDLDYDNWVLFFTGHGASGGGSDLDQGDTRRDYNMFDVSLFAQDDWRVRKDLTINAGVRWDYYGWPTETSGRIGTYYNNEAAARAGVEPGYYINKNHLIFQPGFDPAKMGLVVSPDVPLDLRQVHKAQRDNIFKPDWNNLAPRIGISWKPGFSNRLVFRTGYALYYERPSGSFKTDLQLSSPFFVYQNVPAPLDMADPYPKLNINPFTIPLQVKMVRDANGTPSWRRFDGTPFPATEPFAAKNFTFIDPFIKTPYVQQWTFNIQYEPIRGNLLDIRYVGTRGVGLMAKVNLAQPKDPRVTPVNGFTDIRTATGSLINPDFFVPSEYLGLGRQNGFRMRSNYGMSTYHGLQVNYRRRFQRGLLVNAAYTWAKTLDNISSDGGLIEHDARNSRNNRGPADFDRPHRFTVGYLYELPTPFVGHRLPKAVLSGWALSGMATLQSGTPFSVIGSSTANAYWAQVARVRVDFAPGRSIDNARREGSVQSRIEQYFDPTAFANSEDRWGNSGRNILRGPAQRQFDFAVAKSVKWREFYTLETRLEAFNAFNQATFANPNSTLPAAGVGTAGVITSTIGGPRTLQIGLRFRF
ncbi:MAG TPA: carboxypeptidase regulatory-like domain-containing protein [Bryobacteraceae bacterium]|nr:carboxypeptidase regulatory-like domain-containing protein [Bryobacteraceae bacterium]